VVRCKFVCTSKREYKIYSDGFAYEYEFSAVTGDGSEENKSFWKWTPAGKLTVSVVTDGRFKVGASYFLDLSEAA
jgi:hypothetical protein